VFFGTPNQNESPWWPLFMTVLCAGLCALSLWYERALGASLVGLFGALQLWRFLAAWKRWRLERNLKRDPELWRLYQERRPND
jgi:hypothetical protein